MIKSFAFIILLSSFSSSAAECLKFHRDYTNYSLYYSDDVLDSCSLLSPSSAFIYISFAEFNSFTNQTLASAQCINYGWQDSTNFRNYYTQSYDTDLSNCPSGGVLLSYSDYQIFINPSEQEDDELVDSDLTDNSTLENIQNILLITLLLTALIHGFSTGNKRD